MNIVITNIERRKKDGGVANILMHVDVENDLVSGVSGKFVVAQMIKDTAALPENLEELCRKKILKLLDLDDTEK
ncbi:MAG TPA: hypothetical protein DIT67_06690 [Octadecabacter sp.]|nr:hypothetical protein [Octadecabacter sp.]